MKVSHLTHSLTTWKTLDTKNALASLYRNKLLHGKTRTSGITLARKILKKQHLTNQELSQTRVVVRQHVHQLTHLITEGKFSFN